MKIDGNDINDDNIVINDNNFMNFESISTIFGVHEEIIYDL